MKNESETTAGANLAKSLSPPLRSADLPVEAPRRTAPDRIPIGVCGLSALLAFLAFRPAALFPLIWVAMVPVLRFASGATARHRFVLGFFFSFLTFAAVDYWVPVAIVNARWVVGLSLPAAVFLALLAWVTSSAVLALPGAVAFTLGISGPARAAIAPLQFAAWFTALEWIRSLGPLGFTWGILALSQRPWSSLVQNCDVIGIHGLTFLIALANAALALPVSPVATRWRWVVAGLVFLCSLRGALVSRAPEEAAPQVRVGLIQPSIPIREKLDPERLGQNLRLLELLSRRAARQGAELIVWPETVIPVSWSRSPRLQAHVQQLAVELDADLIVGTTERARRSAPLYNQAVLVTRDGPRGMVRKSRLVPFGEYTPLRDRVWLLRRLSPEGTDYTPGVPGSPLHTRAGKAGVLICFESTFSDRAQRLTAGGAEFLAVITNDDWFLGTSAVADHADFAMFRAIETRRWLIQVANSGQTFVVDSNGHIVARLPVGRRSELVVSVPRRRQQTVQARFGDWVPIACLIAAGLLSSVLGTRRRPGSDYA